MWLRDSNGTFATMTGDGVSCCSSSDEGGNSQYAWRRLYDWRQQATQKYLTENVTRFVLESPSFAGAFFPMLLFGITLNQLSLFGFILAIVTCSGATMAKLTQECLAKSSQKAGSRPKM